MPEENDLSHSALAGEHSAPGAAGPNAGPPGGLRPWSEVKNNRSKMRIIPLALCAWLCQARRDDQYCLSPTLAQGYLVPDLGHYQHLAQVSYGCNPGLKSSARAWWGVIKCENGQWSHTPVCLAVSDCLAPDMPHAKPVQPLQASYPSKSSVAFTCDKGYEFERGRQEATCEDGEWTLPVCTRKPSACGAPARVANAVIKQPYRDAYDALERVEYECKNGYKLFGQEYSFCMLTLWTRAPSCICRPPASPSIATGVLVCRPPASPSIATMVLLCRRPHPASLPRCYCAAGLAQHRYRVRNCPHYPRIENGDVYEQDKNTLTVQCAWLYKRFGPTQVTCVNGRWSEWPVCKAPCKLDQSRFYSHQKEYMAHSDEETFFCSFFFRVSVKCDNGRAYYKGCTWNEWASHFNTGRTTLRSELKANMRIILLAVCCIWLFPGSTDAQNCPSPTLTQGYVVPQQDVYQHGSTVSYSCNPGLKTALETWWGELKCEGGEWSHTPQCIAVSDCFAPEVPHAKPVQALQASYSSSSRVAFACDKGFQFEETDLQEAVCADGQWKLPVCKQKQTACGVPTRVANAVIRHPSQSMFEHTDGVEYQCKHGYKMEGYKYTYCMFSVWTPAPKCGKTI
ncbi:coagulation factor XIII B chain-like [Salminus brasiliensis]|uniref:coagulation factor XIII B chain-like n=1 Tax=Salminus brasiliensis TaxID=930266 RepID=UPI003B82E776